MICLPSVNRTDVVMAPNHTSSQATSASGRTLKIKAKSSVVTMSEPSALAPTAVAYPSPTMPRAESVTAESAALTMSETSRRKLLEEAPDRARARALVDSPDAVERALKLGEDRGCADEEDDQTDRERPRFLLDVVRISQHGLRDLGAGGADQIAHLGDELAFHRGALEDETGQGDRHQDERGEREQCVVGECRGELHRPVGPVLAHDLLERQRVEQGMPREARWAGHEIAGAYLPLPVAAWRAAFR
jgi:hypothetical protein